MRTAWWRRPLWSPPAPLASDHSGSTLPPAAAPVQHPPQARAAVRRAALADGHGALRARRGRRGAALRQVQPAGQRKNAV